MLIKTQETFRGNNNFDLSAFDRMAEAWIAQKLHLKIGAAMRGTPLIGQKKITEQRFCLRRLDTKMVVGFGFLVDLPTLANT